MKKSQVLIEYVIFLLIAVVLCLLISALWNRNAIINGGTFGVEDNNQRVHVRPMTE